MLKLSIALATMLALSVPAMAQETPGARPANSRNGPRRPWPAHAS